jgi:hypothetical protein
MAQIAEPIRAPARAPYLSSESIAFIVMVAVLLAAPYFIYPV